MSPRSKQEYREAVHLRYKNATRREKTAILDEFCATCGCHRKPALFKTSQSHAADLAARIC